MKMQCSIRGLLGSLMCLPLGGMLSPQALAQVGAPPVIVVQPLDAIAPLGGTAEFSVVAVSGTTLSYQWRKDGTDINGAKKNNYFINRARAADAGRYSVEVKNAAGAVLSSEALLEVVPLKFTAWEMTADGFKMQLSGPARYDVVILASSNLLDWIAIATNASSSGVVNFTDKSATNGSARFYRAQLQ